MNEPTGLHQLVEKQVNDRDLDGLVALYEPEATVVDADGHEATGPEAIRAAWAVVIAFDGTLSVTTRHAVIVGDLALLSNDWVLTMADGSTIEGRTAEVARLGRDGTWRYVIDHPMAAADLATA
jgi:ketosteroid isomerase-like protein